jgi:hypothetical protein
MRRSTRHGSKIDEAPDTMDFVGRADDLAVLLRWVLDEHCRVVAVLGIGGVGKTNLAARLAQDVAPSFERVYRRSLRNAPAKANGWRARSLLSLISNWLRRRPSTCQREYGWSGAAVGDEDSATVWDPPGPRCRSAWGRHVFRRIRTGQRQLRWDGDGLGHQ